MSTQGLTSIETCLNNTSKGVAIFFYFSADFVPSRGDLVALLCKVTQADRSFVLNYVLSTQSCISLQPAVFIKQFSGLVRWGLRQSEL